jgi:hypothetical protein
MDPAKLHDFAKKLAAHVRKEERELFEALQRLLASEEMADLGAALAKALDDSSSDQPSCTKPDHATRLRSRSEIGNE